MEMCGESIFIADKSNVPYICSNKLNRKKDETTSSIFSN